MKDKEARQEIESLKSDIKTLRENYWALSDTLYSLLSHLDLKAEDRPAKTVFVERSVADKILNDTK